MPHTLNLPHSKHMPPTLNLLPHPPTNRPPLLTLSLRPTPQCLRQYKNMSNNLLPHLHPRLHYTRPPPRYQRPSTTQTTTFDLARARSIKASSCLSNPSSLNAFAQRPSRARRSKCLTPTPTQAHCSTCKIISNQKKESQQKVSLCGSNPSPPNTQATNSASKSISRTPPSGTPSLYA